MVLEWFLHTFSTTSEQAKLFSIFISVLLAVSLLILNQRYNNRRSRKELLISKLEELSRRIYDLHRKGLSLNSQLNLYRKYKSEDVDEILDIVNQVAMLVSIYFPKSKIDLKIFEEMIVSNINDSDLPLVDNLDTGDSRHPMVLFSEQLHSWLDSCKKELDLLVKQYVH